MSGGNPLRRGAFTLIEIMVAMAIFTIIIAAIYSTWTFILRAQPVALQAAAQVQRQRVAVHAIEDALTCIQSFQASIGYYTFIVQNGDAPEFSFSARLPDTFPRNGKFGDFNARRLTFSLEAEAGPGQLRDLVLRQNPLLMDLDKDEKENPLVLARNVKKFTIECCDTNTGKWVDEWDSTNQLPTLVRIGLVFGGKVDEQNSSAPALSITRIIAIPSGTLPTAVQMPFGYGGAPNNPNNPNNPNPPPFPPPGSRPPMPQ